MEPIYCVSIVLSLILLFLTFLNVSEEKKTKGLNVNYYMETYMEKFHFAEIFSHLSVEINRIYYYSRTY